MTTDYHMHTTFSPDGQDPPEAMCWRAVELGLTAIAFTEHAEWHSQFAYQGFPQPEAYFERIRQCQVDFAAQGLKVLTGVEVGNPHQHPAATADLFATYPFDIKIGSLHWLYEQNIHGPICFAGRDPQAVYADYFRELSQITAVPGIDFIAHFDRIFWRGLLMDFPPDLAYLEPIVRQTWTAVVQSGKGLELNSYHLSDKAHWHEALVAMLTWYREAGGDNILVNSDAHSTRQIATNRDIAARLLREAGFAVTENKPESIDARF